MTNHSLLPRLALAGACVILLSCGGDSSGGDPTGPVDRPDPVGSVLIKPSAATVETQRTVQLSAEVRTQSGSLLQNKSVSWASEDPAVAKVSPSGQVEGVSKGEVRVTATADGVSGAALVTVVDPVESVIVQPDSVLLADGETVQLSLEVRTRTGDLVSEPAATWSSEDTAVAVVSPSGEVSARSDGRTRVTAVVDGVSGSMTVRVDTPVPVRLQIDFPQTVQFDALGDSLLARASVEWSDGTSTTEGIEWIVRTGSAIDLTPGPCSGCATVVSVANGSSLIEVTHPGTAIAATFRVEQAFDRVVGSDTLLTGNGPQSVPFPLKAVDRNGFDLPPELADSILGQLVVSEEAMVEGFPPMARVTGDSVFLEHAGVVELGVLDQSVRISYDPIRPEVYAVSAEPERLGDGDEIQLVGPHLDRAIPGSFSTRSAAAQVEVLPASPHVLRVRFSLSAVECSATQQVTLWSDFPSRVPLQFIREVGDSIDLEPGQTRFVDASIGCWQLPRGRYLVAFGDMGYVERVKTEPMPPAGYPDWVNPGNVSDPKASFRMIDRSGTEGGAASDLRSFAPRMPGEAVDRSPPVSDILLGAPELASTLSQAEEGLPYLTQVETPLEIGGRATLIPIIRRGESNPPIPVRVVAIRGEFAVMVFEDRQDAVLSDPEIMEEFLSNLDRFIESGLEPYRQAFQVQYPLEGSPSGQHYLVLDRPPEGYNLGTLDGLNTFNVSYFFPRPRGGGRWFRNGYTLVHEIAHGFQFAGGEPEAFSLWAVEGGADLMAFVAAGAGAVFPAPAPDRWTAAYRGYPSNGNAPDVSLDGQRLHFGQPTSVGADYPWIWGYGYSLPLLLSYVQLIQEASGLSLVDAVGVVARESLDRGLYVAAGGGLINVASSLAGDFDPRVLHLESILQVAPNKSSLPIPADYRWHDLQRRTFSMMLLAGSGTDYTHGMDRMSHGLFSYDVPEALGFGLLELEPSSPDLNYLILRLE